MITPAGNFWVFLATEPVDFRKGMDGLADVSLHILISIPSMAESTCFDLGVLIASR